MPPFVDLANKRFGRLTVKRRFDVKHGNTRWQCVCDCGKETVVKGYSLTSGHSKSCGCLNRELSQKANRKHGQTKSNHTKATREYSTWCGVIQRCTNPNNPFFEYYGGRGITVCERWRDFSAFYADMGNRPDGTSIDRIDNNKGYEPGNCRWVDKVAQQNNLRSNRKIEFNGKTQSVSMWARELGIKVGCLRTRISRGWDPQEALSRKPQKRSSEREPGADAEERKAVWFCDKPGRGD